MSNRVDNLLVALLNGETPDTTPQSRIETYIKALVDGSGTDGLPTPQSLSEAYFYTLVEKGLSGGGGSESDPVKVKLDNYSHFFYKGARSDLLNNVDTSEGTDFSYMFGQSSIKSIPELDVRNGTNFRSMFWYCQSLTFVPKLDARNGIDFEDMFYNCSKLTSIPELDVRNGTNFRSMFYGCNYVKFVPELDTRNGTNFQSMFSQCLRLPSIPKLNTSNGTEFGNMFYRCEEITSIPKIDLRNATNVSSFVTNCSELENLNVRNVAISLTIGSGTSYGHLLTLDSLINTIRELRDTGSSKTLTMGNTNLAKLAEVYVRTIEVTDEMRVEDEFIDQKLPFEVCGSTDEGATLITDYVLHKNWQLK